MHFGERVKQRRTELGLSQDELARRLGYSSRSTINKIENGTNDVTQSKVIEFAKALNTTVGYLMSWDDVEEKKRDAIELSDAEQQMILNFRHSDDITKQMILRLLTMEQKVSASHANS